MAFVTKWSDVVSNWLTGLVPPVDMGKIMEALLRTSWERHAPCRPYGYILPSTIWPLDIGYAIHNRHYTYPLLTKDNTLSNWQNGKCFATAMCNVEATISHLTSDWPIFINHLLFPSSIEDVDINDPLLFWTKDKLAQQCGYADWASSPAWNKDRQSSPPYPYLEGNPELIDQEGFVEWAIFMYKCLNLLRRKLSFMNYDGLHLWVGAQAQEKEVDGDTFEEARTNFLAASWVDVSTPVSGYYGVASEVGGYPPVSHWEASRPGIFSFRQDADNEIRNIQFSLEIYGAGYEGGSSHLPIGNLKDDGKYHLTKTYSESDAKINLTTDFFLDSHFAAIPDPRSVINQQIYFLMSMDGPNGFKFKDW